MFNLSGSEIIVILLLALVVLGPEKLPDAVRRAGRTYAELKKMGNSFQDEMRSVIDEPVKEMRETADLLKASAAFPDTDLTKPGSGGRATTQLTAGGSAAPARPATPKPSSGATSVGGGSTVESPAGNGDGAAAAPAHPAVDAGRDDEALINRTLSGRTGPPAGDAAP